MFILDIVSSFDSTKWRELILNLGGTPFHLPETWLVGVKPASLRYLVWKKCNIPVAATIGIFKNQRAFGFLRAGAVLHLPVAPVLGAESGVTREDLYEVLRRTSADQRYREVMVDSRWGEQPEFVERLGISPEFPLIEFLIDLSSGEDALLTALHKKHRKNLRIAQESGIEIVEDTSLKAFLSVRDMQQSSADRSAEKGNSYGIQGESFYREAFESIYRYGPGKVLFAKKYGEFVAALAYLEFGKNAVTVRSGSTKVGYDVSAMYLLQFDLFRILAERGFSRLNIGGVPMDAVNPTHPQHGLYNYKRYYGGVPRVCSGFTMKFKNEGRVS